MALSPTQIRTGIVSRLAGATAAGSRVYDSRMRPWPNAQVLPAIDVVMDGSNGKGISASHARFRRVDVVLVQATVGISDTGETADATLATAMDTIEGQMLVALFADAAWWQSFDRSDFDVDRELDAESRLRLGRVGITLTLVQSDVVYEAVEPADELELVVIETDLIHPADDPDGLIDVTQHVELIGPTP